MLSGPAVSNSPWVKITWQNSGTWNSSSQPTNVFYWFSCFCSFSLSLALLGHEHSFFSGPTRQPSPCRRLKYIYSINAFEKRNLRLIVDAPQGGRSLKNYKWNERRRRRRRRRRSEWWRCPYTSVTVIFLLRLLLLWLWWLMMMTWRAFETLSDCWCCIGIFAQSGQSRLTFFSFV